MSIVFSSLSLGFGSLWKPSKRIEMDVNGYSTNTSRTPIQTTEAMERTWP